ncbi:late competence protein ComEA, DNA receptor [Staphylococcus petrasii]|uniref:Competence protein ComEA n=1 Tax=Staphylococcus petrasii TaxID=1276936 RepID=A0A380G0N3_9STAP|nr:helix-hairpin-helix domain-containing protein [Staphylococcus petrasii]MCI2774526.1 helix-hairpin-helix domain-containing protein [Staphylococcus petrasii]PNZ29778.1 competence protein ComEA [Staphylococcus petrasii]TGE13363.1 competence protein ComEA [Staphylococcus petrasii]TGE16175.1 competence protein ComEA [Staphylococcus petrasii]SUM44087.1 late competence protein ComEA, DNA receptor [Staphylococcus petrasii]
MFNNMNDIINFILKWKVQIIIAICVIGVGIFLIFFKGGDNAETTLNNDLAKTSTNNSEMYKHGSNNQTKNKNAASDSSDKKESENKTVLVDVKGAVEKPDVYEMKSSDRVNDVLKKAKLLKEADVTQINLSEKLTDQKMINVPSKNDANKTASSQTTSANINSKTSTQNSSTQNKVNLNTATESDLLNVPGIGPTKVKEILEYKQKNGQFNSVDNLKEIKGIGGKTFEKIKDYFTV